MAEIMTLIDEYGIIKEAEKILPDNFKVDFISALAELENKLLYKNPKPENFIKTRLHKVKGIEQAIYRADIDKISGWRIHLQLSQETKNTIILKQIIEGQKHDNCLKVIKSQIGRYS